MRTERLDIRVPQNADYFETWQINDYFGAPIDLTGVVIELFIRAVAGQGEPIAAAVIDAFGASDGLLTVRIEGGALASVAASEVARLAYDLRLTYPDGVQAIPLAGQIILTPGVTY